MVPRFIEIAKARGEYTIQGTGNQLRSWLFVDDASAGIQAVFEKGTLGDIYNLGTYYEKSGVLQSDGRKSEFSGRSCSFHPGRSGQTDGQRAPTSKIHLYS